MSDVKSIAMIKISLQLELSYVQNFIPESVLPKKNTDVFKKMGPHAWIHYYFVCIFIMIGPSQQRYNPYKYILLDGYHCPKNAWKREIQIGTGAALLVFDENQASTFNTLRDRDIDCHVELEIPSTRYGFHFYLEEVNLESRNLNTTFINSQCKDYVQFGRDTFGIDSFYSDKFCGRAQHVDYSSPLSNNDQGSRMYIENQDDDVDVWLHVNSHKDKHVSYNRTLTLVVTVFKKVCNVMADSNLSPDRIWRRCRNSPYCVKDKYFCDRYSNCGFGTSGSTSGSRASDEVGCQYKPVRYHIGFFRRDNIPINIIVIILVLAFIVLIAGACKKLVRVYKILRAPRNRVDLENNTRMPNSLTLENVADSNSPSNTASAITQNTSLITRSNLEMNEHTDKPPAYDEIVKNEESSQTISPLPSTSVILDRSQPPPYTP